MRRLLLLVLLLLALWPRQAMSAEADLYCATGSAGVGVWQPCGTSGNPIPVTATQGTSPWVTSTDPCSQLTKLGAPFSLTASGQVIAGTSAKKTYICAIDVVIGGTAQNVALVEGTGTVCATNIYGLAGGTTAATGWNFGANSGIARGSGSGTIYSPSGDVNALAANVCLLLSGSVQTSGSISYVQAP